MATSAQALQEQLANGSLTGDWTLDQARSTATLRSRALWGLQPVKGVFGELGGSGTVSPAGEVTGSLTLATGALDTRNAKRDAHLRSGDFFLSEKYPAITFRLDGITPGADGVTVSGTLTVRETTRPASFPATVTIAGDGEVTLDATMTVDRTEFGLTWNQIGMVAKDSTVTVHAVFTRS